MLRISFRALALVIFSVVLFAGAAQAQSAANIYTVQPQVSDSSGHLQPPPTPHSSTAGG